MKLLQLKIIILFAHSLLLIATTSCLQVQEPSSRSLSRNLASEIDLSEHDFRVGTLNLDDQSQLILLGVEANKDAIGLDAAELGFRQIGADINNIDPKFLFSKNSKGIQRVYVFEYGNSSKRRLRKAMEQTSREQDIFYLKIKKRDRKAKLPKLFLDVPDVKLRKLPLDIVQVASFIVGFTPFSIASNLFDKIFDTFERKKRYHAAYLQRIIEICLIDEKFSELQEVFSRKDLLALGGSIRIRYQQEESPYSTFNIFTHTNKNKVRLFEDFLALKSQNQSINMDKLLERASEEGLLAIPITQNAAFLFYDLSQAVDPEFYKSLLLSQRNIHEVFEKYKDFMTDEQTLVPLGLFTMGDGVGPNEAIDFIRPMANANTEKIYNTLKFAADIGMSFVPINWINTAYSITDFGVEVVLEKRNKPLFDTKIYSQSQISVLLEAGLLKIDTSELVTDALLDQLANLGIEEEEFNRIKEKLSAQETSEEEKLALLNQISLMFSEKQVGKRWLAGLSGQYRLVNKLVAWRRLKSFLKNTSKLDRYRNWLKEREGENAFGTRYPSSTDQNPADQNITNIQKNKPVIAFMLSGFTPQKIAQARKMDAIPTIEKYFLEKGTRLNAYATQPIALSTAASILTSKPVDYHGLRSNTPINRYSGKATQDYNDWRMDYLAPANWKKDRVYQHVDSAGVEWWPKKIAALEKSWMNSVPIYDGGHTPKGRYIEETLKSISDFVNKTWYHRLVMDEASGLQAAAKIRKHPGEFNFVVNYYECVQSFALDNNKDLKRCFKLIDDNIRRIFEVAKKDKTLKDADIYLFSDAGHIGGEYKIGDKDYFLNNTGFNLTKFFAGDFVTARHLPFVVGAFESPQPDYSLKFFHDYFIEPTRVTYRGKQKHKGERTVLIDSFSDAQAKLYFKHRTQDWNKHLNYFELVDYSRSYKVEESINLIDELLKFKLKNLAAVDYQLRKHIKDSTGYRPVHFVAMEIHHKVSLDQLKLKLKESFNSNVILIRSLEKSALIISNISEKGQLSSKIIAIKDFKQDKEGNISFEFAEQDPFDLYTLSQREPEESEETEESEVSELAEKPLSKLNTWKTEREWLTDLKDFKYPVLFSHFPRVFNLQSNLAENKIRRGEIPDIIAYARPGYNFNSGFKTQADSGYLEKEVTQISLYHSSFKESLVTQQEKEEIFNRYQLFERDIFPFILHQSNPDAFHQQESIPLELKELFNDFYLKNP